MALSFEVGYAPQPSTEWAYDWEDRPSAMLTASLPDAASTVLTFGAMHDGDDWAILSLSGPESLSRDSGGNCTIKIVFDDMLEVSFLAQVSAGRPVAAVDASDHLIALLTVSEELEIHVPLGDGRIVPVKFSLIDSLRWDKSVGPAEGPG